MVLRKPKAMLVKPGPANYYLSGLEDVKDKFNHPFAKPVGLWKWIYEHITYKGQIVLDPFAGSCTSVIAALESHLRPLAVESNPRHHSVGTEALRLYFRNVTNNNVIFV